MIKTETADWLLSAEEPYIRYQAQCLINPGSEDKSLLDDDPFILENIREISGWREEILTRHDKPGLFMHRMAMLADLGVDYQTADIAPVIDGMLENFTEDGSFPIDIMIPKAFGGRGEPNRDWIICDFPVILYSLLKMLPEDQVPGAAVEKLIGLAGDDYYPCCGSISNFKGPGPRGGMCPYANLLAARALAASSNESAVRAAELAASAILNLWTERKTKKPFLFAMGSDFLKLKFPMVWFNLLHVVSALGGIEKVRKDLRFQELAEHLRQKPDEVGRATSESIYMIFKTNEWGKKKEPSRLMTIMVHRALEKARSRV